MKTTFLLLTTLAAPLLAQTNGNNQRFLDPNLKVDEFTKTFESESREVFALRQPIVASLGLQSGQTVADVGAGTGAFLGLFSKAVGPKGQVFAVDIAPRFVAFMQQRCKEEGLANVQVVQNSLDSVMLKENSIDLIFVCDTYHHFDEPGPILASIMLALRPGGRLIIVDFDREGPMANDWLREHVRASKQVFRQEIEAAGFIFVEEKDKLGLRENYLHCFARP